MEHPEDLAALVSSFEWYLANGSQWSRLRFQAYSESFARYGVCGATADELLGNARAALALTGSRASEAARV